MAGTVNHWLGCALGVIPARLDKRSTKRLFDGVAAFRPSRTTALPRGQQAAGDRAMQMVEGLIGTRLWVAIAIMIRGGQRSPESVRVAAGHIAPGTLEIAHSHLRAVPKFEKTNSMGSWTRPPITLPLCPGEADILRTSWSANPLSSAEAKQLRNAVASLLHEAGYTDIRVPRRDLAEAVDCDRSGKVAAAALRHAKGSAHTITYTGGRGSAIRMEGILRSAASVGALPTQFPPTANPADACCIPVTTPPSDGDRRNGNTEDTERTGAPAGVLNHGGGAAPFRYGSRAQACRGSDSTVCPRVSRQAPSRLWLTERLSSTRHVPWNPTMGINPPVPLHSSVHLIPRPHQA